MKTDSLLTSSSKLSYYQFNSNSSITTSLTDVSNLSILKMNLKQTCSCSTCTCSTTKINSNYFENTNDCLRYIFIILYQCLLWCIKIINELFFKSFWQILIYIKQELQYHNSNIDMISINKSINGNYPLISKKKIYSDLSRYHLSLFEACNRRRYNRLLENNSKNKILFQEKTNSLIDTNIILVPVRSSYCQTELTKNDLQIINIDLKQSEKNIHLHDTFYRRLHEPLIFINRQNFSQLQSNEKKEISLFNKSINKIQSIVYSTNQNDKQSIFHNNLSPKTSGFSISNIIHNSSSSLLHSDSIDQTFISSLYQRKFKQKRKHISNNYIPLALATSLHSNISLYNEDYFLTNI